MALPIEQLEKPTRAEVYSGGSDVKPPELLPPAIPYEPIKKCHDQKSGDVTLSLVIDADGHPRNVFFEDIKGNELDEFALKIVETDLFKPADRDGQSVAFARQVRMHLEACGEKSKDGSGKKIVTFQLRLMPDQKFIDIQEPAAERMLDPIFKGSSTSDHVYHVGSGVTPPKVVIMREAEFSDYARRKKIEGTNIVTLVVDSHGMPQNIRISRPLEPSLDEKALEAVRNYRFKPAMKDGAPVPVEIVVEIRFRLY